MYKMKISHFSIAIISSMVLIFSTGTIFAYDQTTTDYGGGLLRTIPSTYPSQITVNNQTIDYQIDGGTIKSIKFNSVLPSLDIIIDGTSGGITTLNIPRNLIDSKDRFANDAPFVVTKNGKEILPVNEQWSDYSRTIILNFDQGTSVFEIVGTGVSHLTVSQMQPLIKIINPDPHTKDLFGSSIATLNGTIIIGTPNAISANNTRGGVVYLFDGTGKHILTISDPDDTDGDQFGYAVASLGSKIVVGAPNAFSNGVQCGKVYLFDLQGKLLQTITDPDPHKQDLFGYSLAASQDYIMIGSPSHINNKIQSGAAYVFDSSGNKLLGMINPDNENADLFGFSMVQIGDKVAIGAPNSNHGALQAGSVFVFDAKSGNLTLTLRNPSPDNRTDPNTGSDQFGFSLANANGLLVVGERGGDIKQVVNGQVQYETDQSGNVRIYDITNDKLIQTIDDPHPVQNDNFGISVSAYGNKILIGMDHDDTKGYDAGSAFLYDINGNMIQEIQNPTPTHVTSETMGNYFGSSVLLLKDDMVIGSPGDNTGATNAGAVYVIPNNTISVTHQSLSTPLQQFKSGIPASDIQCAQGLELVLKVEDGSPACVKPDSAITLIERGWASQITPHMVYFPGVVKFYNAADGGGGDDNRIFKQLPSTLSYSWMIDFDYNFTASNTPAAYPLALTSTSTNPEQQGSNGNAILVYHGDNSDVLHLRAWTGSTVNDSPGLYTGIPISPNTPYFVRLERNQTQLELSVFSNPARTVQVPGSPVTLTISNNLTSLNFVQHSTSLSSGSARTLSATVDNLQIYVKGTNGNNKIHFQDDYSSSSGWTQVGSSVAVNGSFVAQIPRVENNYLIPRELN